MNKHLLILLFLFFWGTINLFAQEMRNIQSGGSNNTQINTVNNFSFSSNKKELANLLDEVEQLRISQDSMNLQQSRLEQTIAQNDSIYRNDIAKRDSVNQVLFRELNSINAGLNKVIASAEAKNQKIEQLETIISKQKKGNFAPLGLKQINNDQKVLGYTFLISEIAVPIALGVGFECAANKNHQNYKNQISQTLREHNDYYKNYKNYHQAAIWTPIAAGVILYGINVLCNYYYTNNQIAKKYFVMTPDISSDLQGNYGVGIKMSFNF